jgi:hypothetical protein
MKAEDLERACTAFEEEHGVDIFLDVMAEIMQRRMAKHGVQLEFFDEDHDQPLLHPSFAMAEKH